MAKTRIRKDGEQPSKRFTFHFTAAQYRTLSRVAKTEDRTMSSVVRAAVVRYIDAMGGK